MAFTPTGRRVAAACPGAKVRQEADRHARRAHLHPEMAEAALREGAVDVVCMTKHILRSAFHSQVYENREEDIRYCTRCLQACHGKMDAMTASTIR